MFQAGAQKSLDRVNHFERDWTFWDQKPKRETKLKQQQQNEQPNNTQITDTNQLCPS